MKESIKPLNAELTTVREFLKSCRADQEFVLSYKFRAGQEGYEKRMVKVSALGLPDVLQEHP
jgi:hypothetical protein